MSLTPRTLEQLRDLAPGYVDGTLNADDLAAFEVGLRTPALAADLQKEITALQATADAPLPNVPDALDEIRARINREAPPLTLDSKVRRATPNSRAVRVTPPSMPVVEPMDRRRAGKSPGRAGWYAAAVMTAGLAATLFVALDLRVRVATLEGQGKEKSSLLARVEAKLSEKEKLLATLLAGRGNVVLVNLEASAPTGPGMQLFWNVRDGKAVVNAYGLAQVASNRAYMLWMIRDGTPVPLKLFTPDESGRAMVADIEAPTSMTGITLFTVTEESSAGAEAPGMTPFITGTVPAATK